MDYRRFGQTIVLRVDRGEKLKAMIQEVCEKEDIKLATVNGIGACDNVKIGIYDIDTHDYDINEFNEFLELTALAGNVSLMDGDYYGHFHVTLGDKQGRAFGGDLAEAVIGATAEVFIHIIDGQIDRYTDEETGLNLMDFKA